MQNKRDQLQAHGFVITRLISAILRADPDQPERPMRRTATGGLIGLGLSLLMLLIYGLLGFTRGGGDNSWQTANSIIVEKETGTRYVFLDGTLRPALNYASARLAAGGAEAQIRTVSAASLKGVPHGRAIGISGAPDQLPASGTLRRGAWLVCLNAGATATEPDTVIAVDAGWAAVDLPDDQAALVVDGASQRYLIYRGQRLAIKNNTVLLALGYGSASPSRVPGSWLNAFEAGPELSVPEVPGRGRKGPVVGARKTRIGQVLQASVPGAAAEYYLVLADGLLPITPTVARLVVTDPGTAKAYPGAVAEPIPVSAAAVVSAARSATLLPVAGLPDTPPKLATGLSGGRSWCARMTFDAGRGPTVTLSTVDSATVTGVTTGATDSRVADMVQVPPGSGVLVAGQAAPGVPSGTTYLITDLGIRYPLPSAEVVAALGYEGVATVPVPTTVLAMLPSGPSLDPEAARTEQIDTGGSSPG
ncbi:type VII secretion protein EccB [Actinoplanes derwentensis]|uniref:Type VII secretion protein EccB n=1 Tax=Actinoplanes derwentensis TaxID=113562 RepID=A0A1H2CVU0_9ACTN|nr:type VII secretion protein EccB [Actinoplanes derwentensis]GID90232.1 hypothetical protein Ade03nite_91560 [Actinoplanes derwentensis]SDT74593.1 type VII secretion protein EccB [Actinoplanes derwentensis]